MAWVFSPGMPWTTWAPASSSARDQRMFSRSSKRAFSSTMHTACLPFSAARMSEGTSAESSEVRYTVILIASTFGSSTACSTNRSTLEANEWYG